MYSKDFRIYRANKNGNGVASAIQITQKGEPGKEKVMLFWVVAGQGQDNQNGDATFTWKDPTKSIIMKLGEIDVGQILAVLTGKQKYAGSDKGLFHANAKGNTVLKFAVLDNGYGAQISSKRDGNLVSFKHMISWAEGEILRVLLEKSIIKMYGW